MNKKSHPNKMFTIRRMIYGTRSILFGPPEMRRRAKLELVRIGAEVLGVPYIGDDYKSWPNDHRFIDDFKRLSPHNYFSMERKYTLKEFAKYVNPLPGAVAECGSYVGVSAYFIARELCDDPIYLFDSFEGLPAPSDRDRTASAIKNWEEGDFAVSERLLNRNLCDYTNVHVKKGWIPERFAEVGEKKFKLVHIDVDLYRPTLDSLEFFYPRMVNGGIIVMDDYGFENCPGARAAADEFMADCKEKVVHLPTGQGVIIRRVQE